MINDSEDHFSKIAAQYVRGRFGYPEELYDFLLDYIPGRNLAWDCATGSGQAAVDLARRFSNVIATDISAELLALAPRLCNVTFRKAPAERSEIESDSVDLITVAQAAHWFDLPRFWAEALRVLRDKGVIALWGYNWPVVSENVDLVLADVREILAPYWPERCTILHEGYTAISPPLREIIGPRFEAFSRWGLNDYLSHIMSWSATRYYCERTKEDPIEGFRNDFADAWTKSTMDVRWPLVLRVFQKE